MNIRQLEAAEWPALKKLIRAASTELENFGTPNMAEALINLVYTGMAAGQPIWVVDDGGKLVGYCAWLMLPGTPGGMVTGAGTYVAPDYRRKSLSRELRSAAADYWRANGGKYVRGTVASGNEAGRLALEGFQIVGHEVELVL